MVDTPANVDAALPRSRWVESDLLEVQTIPDQISDATTPTWNSARGTL